MLLLIGYFSNSSYSGSVTIYEYSSLYSDLLYILFSNSIFIFSFLSNSLCVSLLIILFEVEDTKYI